MNDTIEQRLRSGLRELCLPEDAAPAMARYAAFLLERNRVMNLTAITDPLEAADLHFLDSAAVLREMNLIREADSSGETAFDGVSAFDGKSVVDVGSGAGFPGLPLRLLEPSLKLTLLDAQRKRVDFLREASALLGLPDVACVHARAEEYGRADGLGGGPVPGTGRGTDSGAVPVVGRGAETETVPGGGYSTEVEAVPGAGRERYDFAVSRAVAALPVLAELCLPLVRSGGAFLAMKSVNCGAELSGAAQAVETLGGQVERCADYTIPGTDVRHRLIVVRKVRPTPAAYPRPFAKIKKRPL